MECGSDVGDRAPAPSVRGSWRQALVRAVPDVVAAYLALEFVKQHSQEMEEAVMRQHIDLYVNNYSIALNDEGKSAVYKLLKVYEQVNKIMLPEHEIFV